MTLKTGLKNPEISKFEAFYAYNTKKLSIKFEILKFRQLN